MSMCLWSPYPSTGAEKKSNICLFKYVQKVNYYCKYSVNKPVFVAVCTDNKQNCATVEPQTKTDCVKWTYLYVGYTILVLANFKIHFIIYTNECHIRSGNSAYLVKAKKYNT